MMRLGYLLGTETTGGVLLGLMTCSPDGQGFEVTFKDFKI
jgi:regulation of enolase protein 1 (concanavalin A-like superfamily)